MRKLMVVLSVAVLFCACATELDEDCVAPAAGDSVGTDSPSLVKGEVIVEFSDEMISLVEEDLAKGNFLSTKSSAMNSAMSELNVRKIWRLYTDGGEWEPRHRKAGLHKWYRISYDTEIPATKASVSLESIPGVVYVEPVRKIRSTAVFNDPYLPRQWHYINDGSMGSYFKAGCDINVEPVWKNYTAGSPEVIVSVVDGGIDMTHVDLKAAVIPAGKTGSKNFVDNSYTIVAHDHGTHVAGTIGAVNNNGIGVCGIAGGNDGKGGVKLMSCQVFKTGKDGEDISGDFYNAIVWGADHGAVISQNSWGHVYDTKEQAAKGGVGGVKGAIDYFIEYAGTDMDGNQVGPMKGGIVIFAAGNDNWPDGWPAEYSATEPLCVSVGSVGPGFTRAEYSNYGDWVTIAAPGGDYSKGGAVYSTLPGDKYGDMQGTSMACPHVSGVAALVISYCGGPGFTNEMLLDRLVKGANKNVLPKNSKIGPLVDALGAITKGSTIPPEKVTEYSVSANSNFVTYTWKAVKDQDDRTAAGYILLASSNRSSIEGIDVRSIPADVYSLNVAVSDQKVGDTMTGTVEIPNFGIKLYTAIVAYDYSSNYSPLSDIKDVTLGENHKPVVETEYTGDYKVKSHEELQVLYHIYDPDGHSFSVVFDGGSAAAASTAVSDSDYRLLITGKMADAGQYTAKYTVTDKYGLQTVYVIDYEILPNHAPVVRKQIDNLMFEDIGQKVSIKMEDYIYDEDGEKLSYSSVMTPTGIVHLNPVDNVLNLTTLDFGTVDVAVTATDCRGEKVVMKFKVLVRDPAAEPDMYPNPVVDKLYVSDGVAKTIIVKIYNSNGALLLERTGEASAFDPMIVDMGDYAPGRYGVTVASEGKNTSRTIIKL